MDKEGLRALVQAKLSEAIRICLLRVSIIWKMEIGRIEIGRILSSFV